MYGVNEQYFPLALATGVLGLHQRLASSGGVGVWWPGGGGLFVAVATGGGWRRFEIV